MRIEKSFSVSASPDTVWRFLTDPYKVAGCLPGAAITEKTGDNAYTGTITVKVGPVATTYKGEIRFERLDASTYTAEIAASGQDVRGKGGADLKMVSKLIARGTGDTEVTVSQDINVVGILAQMGRGMIQDVGDQLFERFTTAMRAQLEAPASSAASGGAAPGVTVASASAEPIQALSFGAGVAGRAVARAVKRPAFWIAVLSALLLLWWILH